VPPAKKKVASCKIPQGKDAFSFVTSIFHDDIGNHVLHLFFVHLPEKVEVTEEEYRQNGLALLAAFVRGLARQMCDRVPARPAELQVLRSVPHACLSLQQALPAAVGPPEVADVLYEDERRAGAFCSEARGHVGQDWLHHQKEISYSLIIC
jgi:hypothetical protein